MPTTYERFRPSLARHMVKGYLDWYATVPDAEKCYIIVDHQVWPEMPEAIRKYTGDIGIILDISAQAVKHFALTDEHMSFSARFQGIDTQLDIPWHAISSMYTITRDQEPISQLGLGGYTSNEFRAIETPEPQEQPPAQPADKKPALRVVK